jgi:hypothetical protein
MQPGFATIIVLENPNPMTWNTVLGLISLIAMALPITFIVALRLYKYKTFPALLCYYSLVFVYHLLSLGYIRSNHSVIDAWNLVNNLLDAPLMLIFLTYFSGSAAFTSKMQWALKAFIAFEIIVLVTTGFNTKAITIILGPGICLVLGFCIHFFIRQTKITIMHRKATGKAIIAASLLFAYGCYALIYVMYYVMKTPYVTDTFLVYFLVVIFSSLLVSAGIVIERKRVQKLHELMITRRELSAIYQESRNTAGFRRAMLDFDRDQAN